MKIYVGNLPFSIDDAGFKKIFSGYNISEFNLIRDNFSGKSKGFGFLTVDDDNEAQKLISEFNGKNVEGRELTVNEARPMGERPKKPFNNRSGFNRRRF
jgi:RNA recognition motif-containing protein